MGDLDALTVLVTGANTGIGRAITEALAARGATVYMACRNQAKAAPVRDEIAAATGNADLHLLSLDLADLPSVRACARAFLETGAPLHVLVNNAGLAGKRGMTASGFEVAFGTNHVGPFLLTNLLLERLRDSAPARVVTVASDAHYRVTGIDYETVHEPTRTRTAFHEYSVSKLANVLHAQELARRVEGSGVTTYSLHPGVIASDVWRQVPWPIRPLMKLRMGSTTDGAKTPVYCATDAELASQTGLYYEKCRVKAPGDAVTATHAAELWERSEAWVS
ncbi:MAG TPA: SDR family NAD(P)-dependent oxidoreductase [Solirubrobacteraceae bacterium]